MTGAKILVPVDYSEQSREALRFAGMLAERLSLPIEVVFVWEGMPRPGLDLKIKLPDGNTATLTELIQRNAENDMLGFMQATELPKAVSAAHRIIRGHPSRKILELLATGEYAFVVMGSCGAGALQHFILGSVAERVVSLSPVPVFTVGLGRVKAAEK